MIKNKDSLKAKIYNLAKQTNIPNKYLIQNFMFEALLKRISKSKYKDKFNFVIYKTVESTNIVARGMAMNGADSGTVVIAEEQTSGYGRNGKSFFSPYGTGIYMSIILNLKKEKKIFNSSFITTAAAMAVSKSIEEISNENTQIKWVNDVFINGKKVCGILTEGAFSFEDGKLDYAVIGIGINVNFPKNGFPEEINNIAVSINKMQNNKDIRNILIAKILERMYEYYFNNVAFYDEYKKRSFLIGKKVSLNIDNEEHIVKVLDIDKTFALVAEFQDGKIDRIVSGSVNHRVS